MKIELSLEEQTRISKLAQSEQESLITSLKGKDLIEQIESLISSQIDLLKQTEAQKWFTKEREKETFNEMVRNYDEKLKEKDSIIDNLKRR